MQLSVLLMLQMLDRDQVSKQVENNRSVNVVAIQRHPFIYRDEASDSLKGCEYDLLNSIVSKDHLNLSIHMLKSISLINKTALK